MPDVMDAPPAAPAAPPPAATDAGPGSEIHVTPGTVDNGPKQETPKKGSAMDRLMGDLRKKAKPAFYESPPETSPTPAEPQPGPPKPGSPTEQPAAEGQKPPAAVGDPKAESKTKNPWKLVDEYKARAAKAESDIVELRKSGVDPAQKKVFEEEISKLKSQNDELEKHLRYVDYQKSSEFRTKYVEPYEKAWERAAKDVAEIRVIDQVTGEQRQANAHDLYKVVASPLNEARDLADAIFGKFADDVMQLRKDIRSLNDAQESALKDAKENSVKREKETKEQNERLLSQTAEQIKKVWESANTEFGNREDLAFIFKPAESDQAAKDVLAKGYKLVDEAFAINSADPRLTAEQRERAVKLHAAMRMRAAGFGALRTRYDAAVKKISELERELGEFKGTVPKSGGGQTPEAPGVNGQKPWDRIRSDLQRIAKPIG